MFAFSTRRVASEKRERDIAGEPAIETSSAVGDGSTELRVETRFWAIRALQHNYNSHSRDVRSKRRTYLLLFTSNPPRSVCSTTENNNIIGARAKLGE